MNISSRYRLQAAEPALGLGPCLCGLSCRQQAPDQPSQEPHQPKLRAALPPKAAGAAPTTPFPWGQVLWLAAPLHDNRVGPVP